MTLARLNFNHETLFRAGCGCIYRYSHCGPSFMYVFTRVRRVSDRCSPNDANRGAHISDRVEIDCVAEMVGAAAHSLPDLSCQTKLLGQ